VLGTNGPLAIGTAECFGAARIPVFVPWVEKLASRHWTTVSTKASRPNFAPHDTSDIKRESSQHLGY
jgi:hypothetical protein